MKKTILATLVLVMSSVSLAQSKITPAQTKSLAAKTVAGYQQLLNSEQLKTCWSQGEFKRLFTNSCTEFLSLTEVTLGRMADSLDLQIEEDHKELSPVLLLAYTVRLTKAFTLSAAMEALQTGDAKEQVDVVVQKIREDIRDIRANHLK